jgi:hypothetical protein
MNETTYNNGNYTCTFTKAYVIVSPNSKWGTNTPHNLFFSQSREEVFFIHSTFLLESQMMYCLDKKKNNNLIVTATTLFMVVATIILVIAAAICKVSSNLFLPKSS